MAHPSIISQAITRVSGHLATTENDHLAIEEPLEIQLSFLQEGINKQQSISITMRTPGDDAELAIGFLFTEGIIRERKELQPGGQMSPAENIIRISLAEGCIPVLQKAERNFYTTSSCGVCGKSSIDAIRTVSAFPGTADDIRISAEIFYSLPGKLRQQQAVFDSTGGLHASAIFDLEGNFLRLREDVGRHNALDKLIGAALLEGTLPLNTCILLLSGRASFELVQKATMAGIKIIAAVGAPSSLAAALAEESGITLVGFLRGERFNIYTHPQRIIAG